MTQPMSPRLDWDWAAAWTGVFVANLPIPVMFGHLVIGPKGICGLCGGLAVLFWIGVAMCLFRFRIGRSLVWGGGIVALGQLLPVLQLFCGAFGLGVWDEIGGQGFFSSEGFDDNRPGWQNNRNVAALVIVFFTAHPLLVAAVLLGAMARYIAGDRPIWFTRRGDPDS